MAEETTRYVRDVPLAGFSRMLADNPGVCRLDEIAMSMNFPHDGESALPWSHHHHQQTAGDCECSMKNVRFNDHPTRMRLPPSHVASPTAQPVQDQGRSSSILYLPFFWSRSMLNRGGVICIPTSQSTLHLIPANESIRAAYGTNFHPNPIRL